MANNQKEVECIANYQRQTSSQNQISRQALKFLSFFAPPQFNCNQASSVINIEHTV